MKYAIRDMNRSDYYLLGVFADESIANEHANELNMYGRNIEVFAVKHDPRDPDSPSATFSSND